MNLDDLAKRLREATHMYQADCELKMKCAARIDELEARIADRDHHIEELEAVYEAAVNDAFEAEAYAEELEAKLAKAVVFAEIVERAGHGALWPLALDILAELKGQNDD
jgi:uncharacterized coiled-coil protein SlyX